MMELMTANHVMSGYLAKAPSISPTCEIYLNNTKKANVSIRFPCDQLPSILMFEKLKEVVESNVSMDKIIAALEGLLK